MGFDATNGFLLNGKHYEIYGTCNHQDAAGVGAAIPDALQEFRVKQLKEFGCNAIRTSHNPPTPELLDACDRLGMLVLDESRLMGSDSENMKKWDDQIRRDRNHPSVAMWSIANEQFAVQDTPQAANVARTMQDYVKQLDPTRPVTYASPEDNVFRGINSVIEVRGWNYHYGPRHGPISRRASEPAERRHRAGQRRRHARHLHQRPSARLRRRLRRASGRAGRRPPKAGGVSSPSVRGFPAHSSGPVLIIAASRRRIRWPCINSHFGILDTCGFPKDASYYYQSWWTTNTVLHLLPHWNWPGREGQEILVQAFSNCKQVELFLNGASLGKQAMKPNSKLSWQVKYAPGTLSAKGFDDAGKVIAETKVETTGDATQIQLTPDRKTINADGEDVACSPFPRWTRKAARCRWRRIKSILPSKARAKLSAWATAIRVATSRTRYVPQRPMRTIAMNDWRWKACGIFHARARPGGDSGICAGV